MKSVAVRAVPQSNPSPAREALAAFKRGELAEAQRADRDAAAALEVARAEMTQLESQLREHEAAATRAPDRETFASARLDADFTRQRLSEAQQRVSATEDRQRAVAQQFSGLEQRRGELIIAVLMEEARAQEAELHRLEAECVQRFAWLDATLNHFRATNVTGKPVEELAGIFERLRAFAIIKDEHRETSRAELRELLNDL